MRLAVALALAVTLGLAVVVAQTRVPLKQDLEVLAEGPMRADRVKDGLYVIRGPFLYYMRGCPPGQKGDGLVHESGDVALRVTPAGLVMVDDKFPDQAADVLAQVRKVSPLPVRYVLNSHHHADHVSGNAYVRGTLGVDVIGHRNIRENFLRLKQAGEPTVTFDERTSIFLGGVEVRLLFRRGDSLVSTDVDLSWLDDLVERFDAIAGDWESGAIRRASRLRDRGHPRQATSSTTCPPWCRACELSVEPARSHVVYLRRVSSRVHTESLPAAAHS